MTRARKIGLVGVAVAVGLPLIVLAQKAETKAEAPKTEGKAETYKVDPIHSSNWFRIKHMNVANFYGRFNDMAGTYTFDDANPAGSALDIQIQTESIDTHNDARNKHLQSAEFFDVEKNPQIAFKSSRVKKTGANSYEAQGDLTLHGVTRPLTVKIERTGAAPGMKGEYRSGFETTFEVKRSDFGMNTMIGPLGDEVRLTISVEGIRQ